MGHRPVVERQLLVADHLDRLVALARDDDDIARGRLGDRHLDGSAAVGLDGEAVGAGHARSDGVDDGQGVLSSRVVGGQEYPIGQAGRHLAHLRALRAVAVAPGAEDQQEPPGAGRLPGREERAGQGPRLVGVVDEHGEGLALVDGLEAARHPGGATPGRPRSGRRPCRGRAASGGGGQRVAHVEAAAEGQRAPPGRASVNLELATPTSRSVDIGQRVPLGGHGGLLEEPPPTRVVEVHHRRLGVVRLEEPGLRGEVVLHVAVEVEVVLGEVREHGDGEPGGPHPLEHEGVGRHLHGHRPAAAGDGVGQHGLELGGLRGGARAAQRADDLGGPRRRRADRAQQVGGGRLAAGAGDPDHGHPARGVVPERVGHRTHRGPHRGHGEGRRRRGQRALGQQHGGPPLHGLGGEGVAIDAAAGHAAEERAGGHGAGVVHDRGTSVAPRSPRHGDLEVSEPAHQGVQAHRSPTRVGRRADGDRRRRGRRGGLGPDLVARDGGGRRGRGGRPRCPVPVRPSRGAAGCGRPGARTGPGRRRPGAATEPP